MGEGLTELDIELIRDAQDYCRRQKARSIQIFCPFHLAMEDNIFPARVCTTCHKWMETKVSIVSGHPCMILTKDEIITRFWRKPNGL